PVLDQAPYAGDLHVQPLGDVGEGEPFGDEVSEVVHAPRVPRGRPCPHPAPPPRPVPLTIRTAAVSVSEPVSARPATEIGLVSAATSTSPGISQLLDDRYRVEGLIARGGMATVHRGHDERLDRVVALKIMHPHLAMDEDFRRRFAREARSAARLAHLNVVGV